MSYGPGHPSYVAPLSSDLVELLRGREFDGMFCGKKARWKLEVGYFNSYYLIMDEHVDLKQPQGMFALTGKIGVVRGNNNVGYMAYVFDCPYANYERTPKQFKNVICAKKWVENIFGYKLKIIKEKS